MSTEKPEPRVPLGDAPPSRRSATPAACSSGKRPPAPWCSRVFAEKGARLTSVEDILAASGVSRRTFYRFYDGKDDVLLALYELGTEGLLCACRSAVQGVSDARLRLERCVDVHLANARYLSRLMFVLGGEAQHHESRLHTRRAVVHAELEALLTRPVHGEAGCVPDATAVRGLIFALEGLVRLALQRGDEGRTLTDAALAEVRRTMQRLCAAATGE
jgi:AcrR family transcriptional regulator